MSLIKTITLSFLYVILLASTSFAFFSRGDACEGFSYKNLKLYQSSGLWVSGVLVNYSTDNRFLVADIFFQNKFHVYNSGKLSVDVPASGKASFNVKLKHSDYKKTKECLDVTFNVVDNWIIKGNIGTNIYSSEIIINGSGDKVSDKFELPVGTNLIKLKHHGKSNFSVWIYDGFGKKIDLLANEIGRYQGLKNFTSKQNQNYYISIEADGRWVIQILKPDEPSQVDEIKSTETDKSNILQRQSNGDLKKTKIGDTPKQIHFSSEVNIYLKNGRCLKAVSYEYIGDSIKIYFNYGTVTYSKNSIDRIDEFGHMVDNLQKLRKGNKK
jgi:hypothetical protein